MPDVTAVSLDSAPDITFTGVNFPSGSYIAQAMLDGIPADGAVINGQSVTATWLRGVPIVETATAPALRFVDTLTNSMYYARIAGTITNPLNVVSSSSGLECSFAGGCMFEVAAQGLGSKIKLDSTKTHIEVCNEECIYSEADSTADTVRCKLPALSTTYSNANFGIQLESEDLKTGKYLSSGTFVEKSFNNNNLDANVDTNANCFVEM
jgi:hypothetical protein